MAKASVRLGRLVAGSSVMDITRDASALAHLATALAIGLLLGLEREHDTAADSIRPAGSRTFPLIALAGAVGAALSPVALGVGLASVAALVVAWYLRGARRKHADLGATTEVAAIGTYLLGALAWFRPELAVPAGAVAAVLLAAKGRCTSSPPGWSAIGT